MSIPQTENQHIKFYEQTYSTPSRDTLQFQQLDYKPLHEDLYHFDDSLLDSQFIQVVQQCKDILLPLQKQDIQSFNQKRRDLLSGFLEPEMPNIYSCKIFSDKFCKLLLEEVNYFEEKYQKQLRPNSMNNNGVVLDEIGLHSVMDVFVKDYFSYFARILNKDQYTIDDHHSFAVEYAASGEKDKDLSVHVDDSELTINLCLGKEGFEGGEVFFLGMQGKPIQMENYGEIEHEIGRCILHDGKHMHGSKTLLKGERTNLIIWLRSTEYREKNPPMHNPTEELLELPEDMQHPHKH